MARRKGHVPIAVLERRYDKLGRLIDRRTGTRPKVGQIPIEILIKRHAKLGRLIGKRA
jgi:hypothetical protein